MLFEAEFWVFIAFVIFMGILAYVGVPALITRALDDRGTRIKAELDEATRLRQEAQALLQEYRHKQQEAEREAETILANARAESERMAAEAAAKADEFVARRTKMAETKIAQAEAQALADVRAASADAAVAAAEKILTQTTKGQLADDLVAASIKSLKTALN